MVDSTPQGQSVNQLQDLVLRAIGERSPEEDGYENLKFRLHSSDSCRVQLRHFSHNWKPQL